MAAVWEAHEGYLRHLSFPRAWMVLHDPLWTRFPEQQPAYDANSLRAALAAEANPVVANVGVVVVTADGAGGGAPHARSMYGQIQAQASGITDCGAGAMDVALAWNRYARGQAASNRRAALFLFEGPGDRDTFDDEILHAFATYKGADVVVVVIGRFERWLGVPRALKFFADDDPDRPLVPTIAAWIASVSRAT